MQVSKHSGQWLSLLRDFLMVSRIDDDAGAPGNRALSAKIITHIGYWNVRTLFDTSKLSQIIRQKEDYNLNMLGLSKVCWKGTSKFTYEGMTILFSGRHNGIHHGGIAIILDGSASRALSQWTQVNYGLMMARFVTSYAKVLIIQCCSQ